MVTSAIRIQCRVETVVDERQHSSRVSGKGPATRDLIEHVVPPQSAGHTTSLSLSVGSCGGSGCAFSHGTTGGSFCGGGVGESSRLGADGRGSGCGSR